jgi:hypothetical protein
MTIGEKFTEVPAVAAALARLIEALDDEAAARGGSIKAVAVSVHTTLGYNGNAYVGCSCAGCRRELADIFGVAIGTKATMIKLAAIDMHSSAKAVH